MKTTILLKTLISVAILFQLAIAYDFEAGHPNILIRNKSNMMKSTTLLLTPIIPMAILLPLALAYDSKVGHTGLFGGSRGVYGHLDAGSTTMENSNNDRRLCHGFEGDDFKGRSRKLWFPVCLRERDGSRRPRQLCHFRGSTNLEKGDDHQEKKEIGRAHV